MLHTPPAQHTNSSSLSQRLTLPPVFPILINETQRLKSETWVIKLNLSHLKVYSIQLFLQPQQAQVSKLPILVTKDTLQLDLYQSISELSIVYVQDTAQTPAFLIVSQRAELVLLCAPQKTIQYYETVPYSIHSSSSSSHCKGNDYMPILFLITNK